MSGYAGDLFIKIRPDSAGFSAGVQQQVRGAEAGLVGAGNRLGTSVAKGILGGFAAVGIAQGLAHQISAGIEDIARVQASTEAVKQEFGGAADAVLSFSETAISEFGATEHATLQLDARLGVLLKNLGIAPDRAAEMAVGLETVAASIAKIRGLDPADVFANLPQALAGNLRSLKQLGFAFDQQQIKREAFRQGLISSVKDGINPAIKAQAIYGLVVAKSGDIQAAAALHSNDLSFQQHRLTAEWDHAREQLATGLLPVLTDTSKELANTLPGALRVVEGGFHVLGEAIRPVASLVGGLQNLIGGLLLLKVASVVKGWAASHLLEGAAVTTETGAVAANTVAVETNTIAAEANVAAITATGEAAAVAATESAALAGSLSGLSKIGKIIIPVVIYTTIVGPEKALFKALGIDPGPGLTTEPSRNGNAQGGEADKFAQWKKSHPGGTYRDYLASTGLSGGQLPGAIEQARAYSVMGTPLAALTPKLQEYQQLQLAAIRAQRTQTLSDDLQIAKEIQSIFDRRVATTKFVGKQLFGLQREDAQAQLAVTNIEQQIASNRTSEAKKRAEAEKTALQQQVDILKTQISGPLDAEINALQNQLTKIQNRIQSGDLKDRLAKARRDLADAQRSVQTVGPVTSEQRREINAYLQPFRREVSNATAAQQEFQIGNRISNLKNRESALLTPLNRTAKAGETQVQLLREIATALRANARKVKPATAKNSKAVPGSEGGRDAATLNGTLVGHA